MLGPRIIASRYVDPPPRVHGNHHEAQERTLRLTHPSLGFWVDVRLRPLASEQWIARADLACPLPPPARQSSTYILPMAEGILAVVCTTPDDPPEDDWLSIAETIEFLPAEE